MPLIMPRVGIGGGFSTLRTLGKIDVPFAAISGATT
jgi:hypothetical protein